MIHLVETSHGGILELDTVEQHIRWKREPDERVSTTEFIRAFMELASKMPSA